MSAATGMSAGLAAPGRASTGGVDYSETGASVKEGAAAEGGFRMPAEWEPHERTLMQFVSGQNWSAHEITDARDEWAAVANAVSEFEPVTMAANPRDMAIARKLLSAEIELVEMPLNDGWSRDSGPIILTNDAGQRRVAGFEFNGWGAKFPPFADDARAKGYFAAHLGLDLYPSDLVLEGGAIAVDGQGTLITTEECLLNPNRNPGWSRDGIEHALRKWLGVTKIIWIPRGLTPDPITDGHIDGMAAFATPGVVLLHMSDDPDDPNFQITRDAKRILSDNTDALGRRFEIIEVPLTSWDVVHMNFYVCNGGVVVPTAGVAEEDDMPLALIAEAFPDREVVAVAGRTIGSGGGGVHCITQQVPAA